MGLVDDVGRFFLSSWGDGPSFPEMAGFAMNDRFIVRGSDGLRDFLRRAPSAEPLQEGRFIGVFPDGPEWIIRTDLSGQELAYVYQAGSRWAVSNSLLRLAREVNEAHLPLTVNMTQVAVSPLGGYGSQPLTLETAYSEVSLLLPSEIVVVDASSRTMSLRRRTLVSAFDSHFGTDMSYEQALEAFVLDSLSTMAGLVNQPERIVIDVSGGYDSRLVASLFHAISPEFRGIFLRSNESRTAEYSVAKQVMEGLTYRKAYEKLDWSTLPGEAAFSLWLDGSAGGYLPVRATTKQAAEPVTRVTGDLSASAKYSRLPASAVAKRAYLTHANLSQKLKYYKEVQNLLEGIGRVDGQYLKSLLYAVTRSRFHCGRDWYRRLSRQAFFTPLATARFAHLYVLAAREDHNPLLVVADLQALVNPTLMGIPHVERRRQWPQGIVNDRARKKIVVPEISAKTVLGRVHVSQSIVGPQMSTRDFADRLLASFDATVPLLQEVGYPNRQFRRATDQAREARQGKDLTFLKDLSRSVQLGELLRYAH